MVQTKILVQSIFHF